MIFDNNTRHIYLLFLLFTLKGQAQHIRTEYYTGMWIPAVESRYEIKRVIAQTDSGYQITDYRKNGKLKFEGFFTSIDPVLEHGHFSFYGKKGALEAEGNYNHGMLAGKWTFYNEKGSFKKEIDYDFFVTKCDTIDGMDEDSSFTSIDSIRLERKPEFIGAGETGFYHFLYEHLVYPPLAAMYFKSGKVIGKFTVNDQGHICNIETDGDVDKDLQMETKRVLSLLEQWNPGTIDGRPVAVKFTCPITYNFQ